MLGALNDPTTTLLHVAPRYFFNYYILRSPGGRGGVVSPRSFILQTSRFQRHLRIWICRRRPCRRAGTTCRRCRRLRAGIGLRARP